MGGKGLPFQSLAGGFENESIAKGPSSRHARAGGHPGVFRTIWIPAFAGMTAWESACNAMAHGRQVPMTIPPSTRSTAPVMKLASSDARKR